MAATYSVWPIEHLASHDPYFTWFDCDTCDDLLDSLPDHDYDLASPERVQVDIRESRESLDIAEMIAPRFASLDDTAYL